MIVWVWVYVKCNLAQNSKKKKTAGQIHERAIIAILITLRYIFDIFLIAKLYSFQFWIIIIVIAVVTSVAGSYICCWKYLIPCVNQWLILVYFIDFFYYIYVLYVSKFTYRFHKYRSENANLSTLLNLFSSVCKTFFIIFFICQSDTLFLRWMPIL